MPGGKIRLPSRAGRVDFEGEIVVVMGPNSVVAGYGLGIDVTARDWQSEAKKKGHPWALSKGCDTFAVLGDFLPAAGVDPKNIAFTLSQNGKLKQRGNTGDMETSVEGLVDYLSKYFTLAEGDLIFTGTPEGVGPMASGDKIEMEIAGTSAGLSVSVA